MSLKKGVVVSCFFLFSWRYAFAVEQFKWAVVGAGPAGIIAISKLLEFGVDAHAIVWIDPEFAVGRLGKYYKTVPGNSQPCDFLAFLNDCSVFQYADQAERDTIAAYGPEDDYPLSIIIEPLQTISTYVRTQVTTYCTTMTSLDAIDSAWLIGTQNVALHADNVLLATGAKPKTLAYQGPEYLCLDQALDKATLATLVTAEDVVAVVGGSHSAMLILKYLSELHVKQIINFYKKPLCFFYEQDGLYYNATDGLKGTAARWAKNVLEKNPPAHLLRVLNTPEARQEWLPRCTKIIYAIGFERSELPSISTLPSQCYDQYDAQTGIIAPHLFGIGIAFPEHYCDAAGTIQLGIGLVDFMGYAHAIIPLWLAYTKHAHNAHNARIFSTIPW